MIPRVREWLVIVRDDDDGSEVARYTILAPTKYLARLNFRHEYCALWGVPITISPKRK